MNKSLYIFIWAFFITISGVIAITPEGIVPINIWRGVGVVGVVLGVTAVIADLRQGRQG